MTKDARGLKLGFGVPNLGFQNYAFLTNAIRQFVSGGQVFLQTTCEPCLKVVKSVSSKVAGACILQIALVKDAIISEVRSTYRAPWAAQ
jgi:hypothetical protein